jgi:hypothetical protein
MERHFTRSMLTVVWTVAVFALLVWSLLAWGGSALLSDSSDWLFLVVEPWVASPLWEHRLDTLLQWGEQFGTIAVWGVWALGSVGLLLTSAFATLLYLRAQRALATP